MATLGAIQCLTNVGNTGNQPCFFDPAFITGAILAPRGATLDASASGGVVLTTLTANFYNASKAARWYPLYDFEKPTDNSDKLVLQSMPNGAKHPVREGFTDWMFQYFDGGLSKHNKVRLFNGTNWDFFFIDTDLQTGLQRLIAIQGPSANILQAVPVNPGGFFWAQTWGLNTGTERTRYELQFSFNQRYLNTDGLTQFVAVPFTFDTALPGLTDVIVGASATVNVTAKHFNVTLVSPLGQDIGALYSAALGAGAPSAGKWVGTGVTGLPLTITSATWVPSTTSAPGYFDILVAATNYPTPPAPVTLNLAAPSVLVAVGVDIESTGSLSIAST